MSIGFDRDHGRRQQQLTDNKNIQGKYHVRFMLRDVFGSAEYQEKALFGLRYKLTLTRINNRAILNKVPAINEGNDVITRIDWFVPHYTPSMEHQAVISQQIINETAPEIRYVKRTVFMNDVRTKMYVYGPSN